MTEEIYRCYRVLELEAGAGASLSLEQLKQARRELAKVWHPDRFPNDEKLQHKAQERLKEINGAYEILEKYLSSGTLPLPPGSDTAYSQPAESMVNQQGSPPPSISVSRSGFGFGFGGAAPGSLEKLIWIGFGVVCLAVVLFFAHAGRDIGYRGQKLWTGTAYKPPVPAPPVCTALDEKDGFKGFRFGMSLDEACAILPPTYTNEDPGAGVTTLVYEGTPADQIGDISIDSAYLRFFEGRLYRIELRFARFPNEIFDALKVNFGEPFDANGWNRDGQPLQAKAWQGNKVYAAILSPAAQLWDSFVMYDAAVNERAKEYAAGEPERAAADFGTNGFKPLLMGMNIAEVPPQLQYTIVDDDQISGVKRVVFNGDASWQRIGYYPLSSVSAEFFHDELYRIDLVFSENEKEIFDAFQRRFGPLQENDDTWTRDSAKLRAKSGGDSKISAVILSPEGAGEIDGGWDSIVLFDVNLGNQAEQFKNDAPKRAAKDF